MFLSVKQHLGYYYQSVSTLPGKELYAVMFQTVWEDVCGDSCGYKFHFYWYSQYNPSPPFHYYVLLTVQLNTWFFSSFFFFISIDFQGINCSLLSQDSTQEFIFSGSKVSACHFLMGSNYSHDKLKNRYYLLLFFCLYVLTAPCLDIFNYLTKTGLS